MICLQFCIESIWEVLESFNWETFKMEMRSLVNVGDFETFWKACHFYVWIRADSSFCCMERKTFHWPWFLMRSERRLNTPLCLLCSVLKYTILFTSKLISEIGRISEWCSMRKNCRPGFHCIVQKKLNKLFHLISRMFQLFINLIEWVRGPRVNNWLTH